MIIVRTYDQLIMLYSHPLVVLVLHCYSIYCSPYYTGISVKT